MLRTLTVITVLGLGLMACGAAAGPPRPVPAGTPGSTPQGTPATAVGITLGPSGGAGAATGLSARTRCEEAGSRVGVADLTWTPAAVRGTQRVAVTAFVDGFARGTFDVSPSLAPDATAYSWRGTNPGGAHRWIVLTLQGTTWTPSAEAQFVGATCVADQGGA